MSRWGKNIVVPLESLHKEKENNNRPTVARSVGTVGKWGKMGFTSTRTYTLSALPAAVAAAAVAAAASTSSPGESPGSLFDDDMSISIPEPPKPKKFFKSRNTAPPEVIAQIIQQLPRPSTSPIRDQSTINNSNNIASLNNICDAIKTKAKTNSAERKKKPQKKAMKQTKTSEGQTEPDAITPVCQKQKKTREEKKLKPETPPSRIISRARKTVNYCEDEDDRIPTPLRDVIPKSNSDMLVEQSSTTDPVLPPPAAPLTATMTNTVSTPAQSPVTPKTPEHPPIVLRISKGTSRLVSTDSDEQQTNSPQHDLPTIKSIETHLSSRHTSVEETSALLTNPVVFATTPKIIVKPPKPPSPLPLVVPEVSRPFNGNCDEPAEINYCTVKISPDKPPKERLKLIIKTDVIRNAIAAAAAAEKAKAAAAAERGTLATCGTTERSDKERKQKNKKHKHYKHAIVEQLTPAASGVEFKIPSPHLALGNSQLPICQAEVQQTTSRSIISPPAMSERDFDSQSSVLGSISSKGNSTPQLLAQTLHEESCVIHSRGSSVITSDLETSQHSSLVAPPSEIELRLESMMEGAVDGEDVTDTAQLPTLIRDEPLQGDILDVLRGDETLSVEDAVPRPLLSSTMSVAIHSPPNDQTIFNDPMTTENEKEIQIEAEEQKINEPSRRVSRRRAGSSRTNYAEDYLPPAKVYQTRGRRAAPLNEEVQKRPTRRAVAMKKSEATLADTATSDTGENVSFASKQPLRSTPINGENDIERTSTPSSVTTASVRGCRPRPNNSGLSNNNIINRIAADLSAKAGAAEEAARVTTSTCPAVPIAAPNTRSYGRKRKNQQVTQVLQPPIEATEHIPPPTKIGNLDDALAQSKDNPAHEMQDNAPLNDQTSTMDLESNSDSNMFVNNEDNASPPRRDYRIKDKFKRTLMLDHQPAQEFNCNVSGEGTSSVENATQIANSEETEQRAAVKLVISKKKGSIFKSRALVPDKPDQAAAKRSHLYKHRWNVEPSGVSGISDDIDGGTNANIGSEKHAVTRSMNDAIFDGYTENFSESNTSRVNSPSLGRITRTMKSNTQTNNTYETNTESVGGSNEVIGNVRMDRNAKEYYTVVRNVKTAHRIQEIGEYQEMDDDVEYILDALQPHNPTPTRCLSALQLAAKCMTPAFRMHVRAHGIVTKFFKALSDANTDLSLGLCTTAIMYILSQEGLNMDLDRDSLELMMNLLEAEGVAAAPSDHANYERNKQKVRELCEEIKAQGKATHLNVDSITVGTLAMETLLSLTSKRAGEWFKEELRELGGLEHIIKTISDCCRPVISESNAISSSPINWAPSVLDNMRTVERCMRVMENVTQMNEENQKYLLTYANGAAVNTLSDLYRLCSRELILYPTTDFTSKDYPGIVIRELLIPLMKVLINMTHTFNSANPLGPTVLEKRPDVIETSFRILLQVPNYVPDHAVFELNILVLLLLINLTMYSPVNRMYVMTTFTPFHISSSNNEQQDVSAIKSTMDYFYKCEELARLVEKNTDAILDCSDKNKKKQEEVDETVNNLLQKAGHHMEHTMKGSYAAILIGHLITDSEENEAIVRTHLRGNGFKQIVSVLEKYYTFMNLTASSEASVVAHIKSTKKLIDYFKKRDLIYEMNDTNDCVLPINTPTGKPSPSNTSPTPVTRSAQRVYKTYSQR